MKKAKSPRRFVSKAAYLALLGLAPLGPACFAPALMARQPSLVAIEIFDSPLGPTYVQLSDLLINGKTELRDCTPFQGAAIDRSTYNKMQKIVLAPNATLERGQDGVLRYQAGNGKTLCAVPDDVKYERDLAYSPSDLADRAMLTGTLLGSASGPEGPTSLQKGVKLVFVAAPDVDLAEFLRAQRAAGVSDWLHYLAEFPNSPHSFEAKLALARLYVEAGEASLSDFDKSLAAGSPTYSGLQNAKAQADKANAVNPGLESAVHLSAEVQARLAPIAEKGRAELQAYLAALRSHKAGYLHLRNAKSLSKAVSEVDPAYPAGVSLSADVIQAGDFFDRTLRTAESLVVAKQMDQALEAVAPLRQFAGEEPRIQAVIDAAYGYYLHLGRQFAAATDWENAAKQLLKAAKTKDTEEAQDALKEAQRQLAIAEDKAAAAKALDASKNYESQSDLIDAFETLDNLPAAQKALVAADVARLQSAYVPAAIKAASDQQTAHLPIHGLADEVAIEKAYAWLNRVRELTKDDSYGQHHGHAGR